MRSSVMDEPASETEAAQFEQAQAETRYNENSWDNEIAAAKDEPPLFYVPEGADATADDYTAGDTQNYAPPDNEVPRTLEEVTDTDSFLSYASQYAPPNVMGPRNADEVQTVRQGIDLAKFEYRQEQANERVFSSEKQARARHKEDCDHMIDNFVAPIIHKAPWVFEMLRYMPDPAEAAYKLARIVANSGSLPSTTHRRLNSLSNAQIDRMDADQLTAWADRVREGPEESEFDTTEAIRREKMKRHNKLGIGDGGFERELDRYKREGD